MNSLEVLQRYCIPRDSKIFISGKKESLWDYGFFEDGTCRKGSRGRKKKWGVVWGWGVDYRHDEKIYLPKDSVIILPPHIAISPVKIQSLLNRMEAQVEAGIKPRMKKLEADVLSMVKKEADKSLQGTEGKIYLPADREDGGPCVTIRSAGKKKYLDRDWYRESDLKKGSVYEELGNIQVWSKELVHLAERWHRSNQVHSWWDRNVWLLRAWREALIQRDLYEMSRARVGDTGSGSRWVDPGTPHPPSLARVRVGDIETVYHCDWHTNYEYETGKMYYYPGEWKALPNGVEEFRLSYGEDDGKSLGE